MRIIGGKYKGTRYNVSGQIKARPTTDFAKEALFNILHHQLDFEEISVLDLFAGIGSISIEFVSRGSQKVWAVEQNRKLVRFIQDLNLKLNSQDQLKVVQADVFKFLNTCTIKFDLIFADPPYHIDKMPKLPDLILNKELLLEGGLLIIEHDKFTDFSDHANYFETRKYGNVRFSFFKQT